MPHEEPLPVCVAERTQLQNTLNELLKGSAKDAIAMATVVADVGYTKIAITKVEKMLEEKYVPKAEFEPVRMIVYGMVGIILVAVIVAVIALVVRK